MKRRLLVLMGCALAVTLGTAGVARAEVKDALLQKLIEKGTISATEAEELEAKKVDPANPLKGVSISGVSFFDYSFGQTSNGATKSNYNRFMLQRTYINIKKDVAPWLKVRVTPDIKSGAAVTGDYIVRLKYAYADFNAPELGPITGNIVRAGLGHTTFIDFEETMNSYRMLGSLFQDRGKLVTSSDLGVSVLGDLGGKLSKEGTATVGTSGYNGMYGSYHIGVYNGGGYGSTTENNQNKSLQYRLSLRPLAEMLPGLQLTYFGVTGEGNANEPNLKPQKWINSTAMLSFQHQYGTLTAEYYNGKGSFGGDTTTATRKNGFSVFGKCNLPMHPSAGIFARYDNLDTDTAVTNNRTMTTIAGVSYRIVGDTIIAAAFERTHYENKKPQDDIKGQVVLQAAY